MSTLLKTESKMTQDLKLIEEFLQKKVNSISIKMNMLGKKRDELQKQLSENHSQAMELDSELREYLEIVKQLKTV
jgi:uncharacterized coiled-coil DUF342 family protein